MNKHRRKLLFFFGLLLALLISLPILYILASEKQVTTTKARAATTLSFTPSSDESSPLFHHTGDVVPLTISLTPGSNHISLVSLEILYDQTVFAPSENGAFSANEGAFPRIVEGPVYSPGKIQVSLSIGADPTQAIVSPTSVGTITLKVLKPTAATSRISFGSNTKVLSLATADEANENVLSLATPAFISSPDGITTTPSTSQTTGSLTKPKSMMLSFSLSLPGIGSKSTNPDNNPTPKHMTRTITYELTTKNHERVLLSTLSLIYDVKTGFYKGISPSLPSSITPGSYYLTVELGGYLNKQYPTPIFLQTESTTQLPTLSLTPGDIDTDGRLTAFDYGILLDCYSKASLPMSDPRSEYNSPSCVAHDGRANADINDDGIIDAKDLAFYQTSSSQ